MGIWTVWEHPRHGDGAPLKARFVKDSFSWAAFLLAPLWLLANRMILVLVVLAAAVVGAVVLAVRADAPAPAIAAGLGLALLWFGFEARGLRRWSLAQRGYKLAGVVEARRYDEAERRYFEDRGIAALPRRSLLPPPLPAVPARMKP